MSLLGIGIKFGHVPHAAFPSALPIVHGTRADVRCGRQAMPVSLDSPPLLFFQVRRVSLKRGNCILYRRLFHRCQ